MVWVGVVTHRGIFIEYMYVWLGHDIGMTHCVIGGKRGKVDDGMKLLGLSSVIS